MIGLDTNVLVRYLTQDDVEQAGRATRIIERELAEDSLGFIGLLVLVEMAWVLQRFYRAGREEILETVNDLLGSHTIVMEHRDVVARAVSICGASGCGFADAVIAASAFGAGSAKVLTFDRNAARAGMTLIE